MQNSWHNHWNLCFCISGICGFGIFRILYFGISGLLDFWIAGTANSTTLNGNNLIIREGNLLRNLSLTFRNLLHGDTHFTDATKVYWDTTPGNYFIQPRQCSSN